MKGWLVSPAWDGAFVLGPTLGCAGVALTLPPGREGGLAAWLLLVVAIDVAHVWATLYRTWLDPEERAARAALLTATPLAVACANLLLAIAAPRWFWTILAYLAVFHFVRQPIGFAALYRLSAGLPLRDAEARLERLALYVGTLGPVVWWHSRLPLPFAWFTPDDFLLGVPRWAGDAALWAGGGLAVAHGLNRLRSRRPNPGGDLWVFGTLAAWWVGIVLTRADLAFTLTNIVAHGVPYFALVALVGRRRWRTGTGPAVRGWFAGAGWLAFAALPVALALVEELAWERWVWSGAGPWLPLATAMLAVPQVTHYLLDGFIWKLGPGNPLLAAALGRPASEEAKTA